MIDDAGLPRDELGGRNALVLGLVREHRAGDDIADRVNAFDARLKIVADFDLVARIERNTRPFESKPFGVGTTPDRDEHAIGLDRFGSAAGRRFDSQRRAAALHLCACHLGRGADREALLLEYLGSFLSHFSVHAGEDLVEIFDHGHLRAQALPDAAELKPDDAAADDDEMFGHLGQRQGAGRIDDYLLVDLDSWQRCDARTRGDDEIFRAVALPRNLDCRRRTKGSVPFEPIDLVLLEQEFDAAGQFLDCLVLLALHCLEIERHAFELDPKLGERS